MKSRLAFIFASALVGSPTLAQTPVSYPSKSVRFVVPFSAGGGNDTLARIVGNKLSERLGQPVVIENKPGASGNIGMALVAQAPNDGYTLSIASNALVINPSLYDSVPFDPVKDFTPIALLATNPHVLLVNPSVPAKSVTELIALARTSPGRLNYASSGIGTPQHLAAELFRHHTGVTIVHVPYKGAGPSLAALLSGEVSIYFGPMNSALAHMKAGRLRALAVTSSKRSAAAPELPTIAEAGLPGYDVDSWFGVVAPVGTPREIVLTLNAEINRALGLPDVAQRFASQGFEATPGTPEEFAALIHKDLQRWAALIKAAGIKGE